MIIFDVNVQNKILKTAQSMKDTGYTNPIAPEPGCARSVSECYVRAGVWPKDLNSIALTYDEAGTFTTHGHTTKIDKPVPGCVVFFDQTYDPIDPPGIGPEDTYTHVGIVAGTEFSNGMITFWNWRSSAGWVINNSEEIKSWGWKLRWDDFRIPEGYSLKVSPVIIDTPPDIQWCKEKGIFANEHYKETEMVTKGELASFLRRVYTLATSQPQASGIYEFNNATLTGKLILKEGIKE